MTTKAKSQMIPPDAYPQMVSKAQGAMMARTLRSAVTAVTAARVIEDSGDALRGAVLAYVEELEGAGMDIALLSEKAHEIRGFAETAGMQATGRIADGLCRYFEEAAQCGVAVDAAVVTLHVSAMGRVARDPGTMNQMRDAVAKELAVLTANKLAESRRALKKS